MPERLISGGKDGKDRRRREYVSFDVARTRPASTYLLASSVAACATQHARLLIGNHDARSVRQIGKRQLMPPLRFPGEPLGMQHKIISAARGRTSFRAHTATIRECFRVLARHSKQGRCPAAKAVTSSRKNNSV